jgi:hypothetical protein
MDLFKDVINGILRNNREVFNDPEAERVYTPFLVNRALSYHQDSLYYANQLNQLHHLDKRPQIDFYLNTIRSHRRDWVKWVKPLKEEDLQAVKMYFGYSTAKAIEAMKLLTDEQITTIKERLYTGD